jgi:hypothetical protein
MQTEQKKETNEIPNEMPNGGKFTDVFLSEGDHNGKRYIATWVYSVLLLLALFISLLAIPALSKRKEVTLPSKEIKLQLDGPSTVHVSVGPSGIDFIEINQPKKENTKTPTNPQTQGQSINYEIQSGSKDQSSTTPVQETTENTIN